MVVNKLFLGLLNVLFILVFSISCNSVINQEKAENQQILNSREEIQKAKELLTSEKKIDRFTFSAVYMPWEYIVARENNGKLNEQMLKKKVAEINDLQYYTFHIEDNQENEEVLMAEIDSKEEYYQRIQYFSFEMQNDLKLVDGEDTLDCVLFHFERNYGIKSKATFSLGFPLTAKEKEEKDENPEIMNQDKVIIYDDHILGVGKLNIKIDQKNLNKIPEIRTQ
jgi:hypothetical protein